METWASRGASVLRRGGGRASRGWALLLVGAVLGCDVEPLVETDFLPVPFATDVESVVLRYSTSTGTQLHGFDAAASHALQLEEGTLLEGAALLAIGLPRPLSTYSLSPGPLPSSGSEGLPLLAYPEAVSERFDDEESWHGADAAILPADVTAYRLPEVGCSSFVPQAQLHSGVEGRLELAVSLDDTHVLIGFTETAFVMTATGVRTLSDAEWSSVSPIRRASAGGGVVWAVDSLGRIFRSPRGHPLAFEKVDLPRSTTGRERPALSVGGTGGEDIYLVGRDEPATIYRRAGEGWEVVGEVPEPVPEPPVGFGTGRALLRTARLGIVYFLEPTQVVRSSVGTFGLFSSLFHPELGLLVGNADGEIYRWESDVAQWSRLSGKRFGFFTTAMAPYERGLLSFVASGTLVQYFEGIPCDDQAYRPAFSAGAVLVQDDGFFLASSVEGLTEVLYLTTL